MAATQTQWWQKLGNGAQLASAAIAILGFGAILLQLNEIRTNNKATSARQVYLAYTDLNFRNPQFNAPDYEKLKAGDRLVFDQYKSFVSYLLYACSEVLYAFAKEPEWRKSCDYEIRNHLPFLCETQTSDPKFLETFGDAAQDFVKAAMARDGVAAPECRMRKS